MNIILRKAKGITLIALVVTVIVLLILAAVSVNLISGSEGILSRTQQATDLTIRAQEREQIVLVYDTVYIDHYQVGGVPFKAFAMEFDRIYYPNKAKRVEGVDEIPAGEENQEVSLFEKVENLLIPTAYATEESPATGNYDSDDYYNTQFNYAKVTYNTGHIYYVALRYGSGNNPGTIVDPDPAPDPEPEEEDDDLSTISYGLMAWQEMDSNGNQSTIYANAIVKGNYNLYAQKILDEIDNNTNLTAEQKELQKETMFIEGYNSQNGTNYPTNNFSSFVQTVYSYNNVETIAQFRAEYDTDGDYNDDNDFLIQWQYVNYADVYGQELTITCTPKTVNNVNFSPKSVIVSYYSDNSHNTEEGYLADFETTVSDAYILKLYEKDDYTANGNNATVLDTAELNVTIFDTVQNIPVLTGEDEYFTYEYVGPYSGYSSLLTNTSYSDLEYDGVVGYAVTGFSDAGKTYFGNLTNANVQIPSTKTLNGLTLPVVAVAGDAFDDLGNDFNIGYNAVPGDGSSEPTLGYNFTFGNNNTFTNRNIAKFTIPSSVKYLGTGALGCVSNNYVEVQIAEGLQYLGEYAFGAGTGDYENNFDTIGSVRVVLPNSLVKSQKLNSEYVNAIYSISPANLLQWNDGGENGSTHNLYSMNQSIIVFRGSLSELNAIRNNLSGYYTTGSFAYGSCIYCTKDQKCAVLDIDEVAEWSADMWYEPADMEDYIQDAIDKAEENSYACPTSASDTYTLLLNRLEECGYTQVLN